LLVRAFALEGTMWPMRVVEVLPLLQSAVEATYVEATYVEATYVEATYVEATYIFNDYAFKQTIKLLFINAV
jgi:hypothetical protein